MAKKLYKSKSDKMLDGICAGVASYINLDPTVVRVLWAIWGAMGGMGVLIYIICAIVIPREP